MRSHWKELIGLPGTEVAASGQKWVIRYADVVEDQRSTRLALLLDLEKGNDIVSARLLFPAETHIEHKNEINWILDSLKVIIEDGRLKQNGIYAIG